MEEKNARSKQEAWNIDRGTPFNEMVPMQKCAFVLKVVICAISFGFIFPDVMNS